MADSRETYMVNAFVTGWPIKHSRSPLIHRHWLKRHDIHGSYKAEAVAPEEFPAFIHSLKQDEAGYRGGNVTIPHKELAYQLSDKPDEIAQELGAANTLWMNEGLLHATNTDGYGFTANLDYMRPGWDKAERAVVFGAGGASRAVIQAIRDRGFSEIHVINRTLARAQELRHRFGSQVYAHSPEALSEVMTEAGLFVNTTSVGMDGSDAPDIDFSMLAPDALVTDIVYIPLMTPLLRQARKQGFRTADGLGMLLHQAVPGFEKWFGFRPEPDQEIRELVIRDMEQH
ncbi:shikimate dehydrogenase [Rhizobium deserti]|uniref:Shikimate dehydrogenase (NADP(+)) n=1 Tax=Rhizobium deserti TaxID=2547961 RepID=A0A4R5U7N6_9HYPH|nr:shikimate dehydrogenase [Rhizobium deserti]TDK30379.1 shikimate dehydrogenase [Rhizobium deserti]